MDDNKNRYTRLNFKMAITGILLGLSLLFQFLSNYMEIAPFMTINLSLAFIVPIFFVADYKFGMIGLFSKFVIGIFMNPEAFFGLVGELVGQIILLFAGLIYILLVLIFKKFKLLNSKYPIIIGLLISTIISTLVMTLLNGILFFPLYNFAIGYGFTTTIVGAPWGIKTYWSVIFAVFMVGNFVNYGVTSFILIPVLKIVRPSIRK